MNTIPHQYQLGFHKKSSEPLPIEKKRIRKQLTVHVDKRRQSKKSLSMSCEVKQG